MKYLSFLLLPLAISACVSEAGSNYSGGPPPVFVELLTLERQPIRDVADMVGQLDAEESVMIQPETEGVVAGIGFLEGHEVEAGTLLFELRDAEERARLDEAEATLALAENEFRRAETLRQKQSVSAAELERARAELEVARARRDRYRTELERTKIRAPFDGVLGTRLVSIGDRVDRDSNLVRIDAVERLRLIFTLPEIALPLAKLGTPVTASVVAYPDETFPGEVYFVDPALDPKNRRVLVKAIVPNPDGRLRPGMFANIKAEIANREDALVVPDTAVAYDLDGAYVWRVDENQRAARAGVELGIRQRGRIEITRGLEEGDRIVSVGTHKVTAGSVVTVAPGSPDTAAGPAS